VWRGRAGGIDMKKDTEKEKPTVTNYAKCYEGKGKGSTQDREKEPMASLGLKAVDKMTFQFWPKALERALK
jgi:hypothetical protein